MSKNETFTREQLIEKYDFLKDVDMSERPLKVKINGEVTDTFKFAVMREFDGEDQVAIDKDQRAKTNGSLKSLMLMNRCLFVSETKESDAYRSLTMHEAKQVKSFNLSKLSDAMKELSGVNEDFLDD